MKSEMRQKYCEKLVGKFPAEHVINIYDIDELAHSSGLSCGWCIGICEMCGRDMTDDVRKRGVKLGVLLA